MAKADIQQLWEDRINAAKKNREDWEKAFQVEMSREYFEGKQNPGYPANEWITINKVYSHLMAQLPMLYSIDPYFYVKLKKSYNIDPAEIGQSELKGQVRQDALNYYKGELNLKEKARMAIQSAHFAYGVIKTHYKVDEVDHPNAGKEVLDDEGKPIIDPDTKQPQLFPDKLPTNQRYAIEYICDDDLLWDEDAGPLQDSWKWIAQKITMTKDDALKDPRFTAAQIKDLQPAKTDKQNKPIFNKNKKAKEPDMVIFWEIYDLKHKQWLIIAENARKPLQDPRPLPPGVEDHPFSVLRFTLREKSPYPIPPISMGLDLQKEYNLSRSRLLTHRKRFNRKYEVNVNKLEDPDNQLPKIEAGEDGTIIRAIAEGAVTAIQDAPLDQMGIQEIMLLNGDINEILGSPGEARGIAESKSATQAAVLDKRLEVKEGDRLSIVVDFITTIARKLDQLIQAHIDQDMAVKIEGPQGEAWKIIKTTDYDKIAGEFEYSVNVGASQPRLPDIERAQWIAFLSQVVIPFPHILTAPNLMKQMARMFHIEDEASIEELRQLGLKMLSGAMPMPGQQGGNAAGVPNANPAAAIMGMALGQQGGNVNGGGSPQSSSVQ